MNKGNGEENKRIRKNERYIEKKVRIRSNNFISNLEMHFVNKKVTEREHEKSSQESGKRNLSIINLKSHINLLSED